MRRLSSSSPTSPGGRGTGQIGETGTAADAKPTLQSTASARQVAGIIQHDTVNHTIFNTGVHIDAMVVLTAWAQCGTGAD